MEYLPGFKWALPKAFSDAVSMCCFEEGDVLYDAALAYEGKWESSKNNIEYHLQVKYPSRGTSQNASGSSIFKNNWESEVRIELYKNNSKVGVGQVHTTQGRLYSALWKGDINLVLDNSTMVPPPPLGVQDVTKSLGVVSTIANKLSKGAPVFVMVKDDTGSVSRQKYNAVEAKLSSHMIDSVYLFCPKDAGLEQCETISPTIQIAFFVTTLPNVEVLEGLVKEAVYVPSKGAEKDMFRVSSHGRTYPDPYEKLFIYQDAKGNISKRNIFSVSDSEEYIQGVCRSSGGIKTFRKDRVLEYIADPAIINDRIEHYHEISPPPKKPRRSLSLPDICFTGFKKVEKESLIELARKNSLNVRSSVTKNLSFLCCGYNAGQKKIEAARKQGVLVFSEYQFRTMLETGELPEEFNG